MAQDAAFGKGEFIKIDSIDFKVPVRELLNRQLIVETLTLKGLRINLVKNQDGTTNWELASQQIKQRTKSDKTSDEKAMRLNTGSSSKQSNKKLSFALAHFDINDGNIIYTDKSQAEVTTVKDLKLKGDQNPSGAYPIQGQFDIQQYDNKHKQAGSGHIDFNGQAIVGETITALFDIALKFEFPQNPVAFRKANGSLKLNFKANKSIVLDDIRLNVGEQEVKGNATIPHEEASPNYLLIKMNTLDLDKLNTPSAQNNAVTPAGIIKTQAVTPPPAKSNNTNTGRALSGEILMRSLTLKIVS